MSVSRTNPPDWSALMPVVPAAGSRPVALYRALRRSMETGALARGAKLPPSRDLARRLGISRGAVVAAFEMLAAEGFVEARVGAGTFVAAAVPRAAEPPSEPVGASPAPETPLPGTLGVAMADATTLRVFRSLLTRRLARPSPAFFHYGDPRGGAALRAEIAAYLRVARGVVCDAERIVVTSGTQQGLDLFLRAALRPGDRMWIEDPCYPRALDALRGAELEVVGVPVDGEGLDVAAGEARAPAARAVYVTPSHQFPLGVTLTMRRRLALVDWARRADAFVVEDDYDSEFRWAGAPLAALQGMDASGRVVHLGTFSKSLGPGFRVGWMVVPDALLEKVIALRERGDRFPAVLAEEAIADLLRQGHFARHLKRVRREARAARDALVAGLAAAGLAVAPPDQGLHLVVPLAETVDDRALAAALAAVGLGARALSTTTVAPTPRRGLVIGFSGWPAAAFAAATREIAPILAAHGVGGRI